MATPNHLTKFKDAAQARALTLVAATDSAKRLDSDHYVEGYAALYEPYVLYYDGDEPIYERFAPGCFDSADMGDIIMQYDHCGRVMARTANGTLVVEADERGLFFAADLGRTEPARSLYDDVAAGMVTKMSWRFRVGDAYYDEATRTLVHTRIAKVYDVSAVSIPANDDTVINARALVDGEIARAARRDAAPPKKNRAPIISFV